MAATGIGCALDFYRSINPDDGDVSVVDINLPDQSGFLLAGFLRRNTDLGIIVIRKTGCVGMPPEQTSTWSSL